MRKWYEGYGVKKEEAEVNQDQAISSDNLDQDSPNLVQNKGVFPGSHIHPRVRLIIMLEEILELAAKEQEVIIGILEDLRLEEKELVRLFEEIAEEALRRPELLQLLQVITLKQFHISTKIFQLGLKEFALASKIRVAQDALHDATKYQPLKTNNELVKLVIKEQKTILRFIENLAEEERIVFALFLRAIREARVKPELIPVAQEIADKELAIAFKFGALGFKEEAVTEKLRAAIFGPFRSGIDTNQLLSLNVEMQPKISALQGLSKNDE